MLSVFFLLVSYLLKIGLEADLREVSDEGGDTNDNLHYCSSLL